MCAEHVRKLDCFGLPMQGSRKTGKATSRNATQHCALPTSLCSVLPALLTSLSSVLLPALLTSLSSVLLPALLTSLSSVLLPALLTSLSSVLPVLQGQRT